MVLHLPAQGLEEGDEHLPTFSCGARMTLPYLTSLATLSWKLAIKTSVWVVYLLMWSLFSYRSVCSSRPKSTTSGCSLCPSSASSSTSLASLHSSTAALTMVTRMPAVDMVTRTPVPATVIPMLITSMHVHIPILPTPVLVMDIPIAVISAQFCLYVFHIFAYCINYVTHILQSLNVPFVICVLTLSLIWCCWLGDRSIIRPLKSWVLVCWWWQSDWSFTRLIPLSPSPLLQ